MINIHFSKGFLFVFWLSLVLLFKIIAFFSIFLFLVYLDSFQFGLDYNFFRATLAHLSELK